MRTLFPAPEGVAQQLVIPGDRADFGWQVVNAAGWSASRLGEAIDVVARYAFDLETEIPLRATLFRASDDEHVLVVVLHHIAADGWSITPLVRDLGAAYASRCAGARLAGRRWRCSTPITRCGSDGSWVNWTIRTARSPASSPIGSRPWPAAGAS
ncbi:condensation domain protein [Mycobacterium xenopi 4042]|uniref:Condensation domain protein n=1 Tax=Mycobacterium xenopi 4042 TaxID=1299334 RepID=X8AR30_MYCXE|nr:condensation domain protein [Mycobacterium xenopi 4042]